jgi:hypothetical protein
MPMKRHKNESRASGAAASVRFVTLLLVATTAISMAPPIIRAQQQRGGRGGGPPNAAPVTATPTTNGAAPVRHILADGSVELTFSDGTRRILKGGTTVTIAPNGRKSILAAMDAMRPTPPVLPSEPAILTWINGEAADLLETIQHLVGNDSVSVANYLATENAANAYQKVDKRVRCIFYLLSEK